MPYADDEMAVLLQAASDPADRVLVLLGAHAGLRAQECTDKEIVRLYEAVPKAQCGYLLDRAARQIARTHNPHGADRQTRRPD